MCFDVSHNDLCFVDIDLFAFLTHNSIYVMSSAEMFCCFPENIHCSHVSTDACGHLLDPRIRTYFVFVGAWGLVTNILAILNNRKTINCYSTHTVQHDVKKTYTMLVASIELSSVFTCVLGLQVFSAYLYFGKSYPFQKVIWLQSPICFEICFSFYLSVLSNLASVQLMTTSQFFVIMYPLETKFKESPFVFRIITQMYVVIFIVSIIMSSIIASSTRNRMQVNTCFPVGILESPLVSSINFGLLFVTKLVSFLSIPYLYARIVSKVKQKDMNTLSSGQPKETNLVVKAILTSGLHFLGWLPLSVAFLIAYVESMNEDAILWSVAVVLTMYSFIYPVVFDDNFMKKGLLIQTKLANIFKKSSLDT